MYTLNHARMSNTLEQNRQTRKSALRTNNADASRNSRSYKNKQSTSSIDANTNQQDSFDNWQFRDAVVNGTMNVYNQLGNQTSQTQKISVILGGAPLSEYSVWIGFSSTSYQGFLIQSLDNSAMDYISKLFSTMYRIPLMDQQMKENTMMELTNMMMGNIHKMTKDENFRITVPQYYDNPQGFIKGTQTIPVNSITLELNRGLTYSIYYQIVRSKTSWYADNTLKKPF